MRHRSERPLVIAHRGASAYRPENTLPAYALAVEQGADMIEIDLHLTNDSRIVIAHDSDLDHFGASGSIAESSLAEMKALDAGHKKGVAAEVPTLEEVLDAYGHRIAFNLEFKWAAHGDYLGLESRTLKALNSRGLLDSTLFSSFRESVLRELKRLSPDSRIALLIDPLDSEENRNRMVERAVALGAEAVNPHHFFVNPAMVEAAHQHDLAVYTYTVDDEEEMRRVVEAGVDGIFTNRPDRMRAIWPAT
ncbi:MAG: glycerophosphodiester phosphodiesterase [Myxococcota bacterium]|nr:glycerophosphodiester phosphodiesterase [Myxococcota bacterium]